MKTTKNSFKSPTQAIVASKLVMASSALHADFTDGSKVETNNEMEALEIL